MTIDEDYSYESYYSESVTAQAKQAGVQQDAGTPSSPASSSDTCHQVAQTRPPVKPEAEDSRAGANYKVDLSGDMRTCLSWIQQHAPAYGCQMWMCMVGAALFVVLQVMGGFRRRRSCRPGARAASLRQRIHPWFRRAVKGAYKIARQAYFGAGPQLCTTQILLAPMLFRAVLVKAGRKLGKRLREIRRWTHTRLCERWGISSFRSGVTFPSLRRRPVPRDCN